MLYIVRFPKPFAMEPADFLLAVVTRRPEELQKNLPAYLEALAGRPNWEVAVLDDAKSSVGNAAFLLRAFNDTGIRMRHLSPRHGVGLARIVSSALSRDVTRLFSGSFGSIRNTALAFALAGRQNAVFVDDDTFPLYDFAARYEARFSEGWKLVPGGFEGHVHGSAHGLLYSVGEALNELRAGILAEKDAGAQILSAVRGVPPRQSSHSRHFFSGGNLGVSLSLASRLPFPPFQFRIEDAVFSMAASDYLSGDGRGVFRAYNDRLALLETPLVRHARAPTAAPSLHSRLVRGLKGAAVARLVSEIGIQSFVKESAIPEDGLSARLRAAEEAAWSDFNMENHKQNISGSLGLIPGEAKEELARIAKLEMKDVALSPGEVKPALDDLSFSLKAWPYVAGALEGGNAGKEVLAL